MPTGIFQIENEFLLTVTIFEKFSYLCIKKVLIFFGYILV